MRYLQRFVLVLFCTFLAVLLQPAHAQGGCGYVPSAEYIKHMKDTRDAWQSFDPGAMRGTIRWVPVKFHVLRSSACTGGADEAFFPGLLDRLNLDFGGANVQFFQCGPVEVICSDQYFDMSLLLNEDDVLCATHDVPNTLNLYIYNTLAGITGQSLAGTAEPPTGASRVHIRANTLNDPELLTHEVGHYFGLLHTHQDWNNPPNAECANGSNGLVAGDLIQDTPAEPNYFSVAGLLSGCSYVGLILDPCGSVYNPDVANYMNYAPYGCQKRFTPGQLNRIAYGANVDRPFLFCAPDTEKPCFFPVTVYPYFQNFNLTGFGDWFNSGKDNFNWITATTGPQAPATGPAVPGDGPRFAYIEATGNVPNKVAVLESPCFDLTYTQRPELSFLSHMNGANIGRLTLEGTTNGGATWFTLYTANGNMGNVWNDIKVDLSQYVSHTFFKFRFCASTTTADLGDIAIDDFKIYSNPCAGMSGMSIVKTDPDCHSSSNGEVQVVGAPGGSSYQWASGNSPSVVLSTSAGMTGLVPGPYQVSVTQAGCTGTLGAFVEIKNMRITLNVVQPSSVGGTGKIQVNMVGGTAPYLYVDWSGPVSGSATPSGTVHTIVGLPAGEYDVRVKDWNGCWASATATVVPYNVPFCQCTGTVGIGDWNGGLGILLQPGPILPLGDWHR
jgi:MAM domain, meprin/A5/mu/Pregnancy-associated plasma protein-A